MVIQDWPDFVFHINITISECVSRRVNNWLSVRFCIRWGAPRLLRVTCQGKSKCQEDWVQVCVNGVVYEWKRVSLIVGKIKWGWVRVYIKWILRVCVWLWEDCNLWDTLSEGVSVWEEYALKGDWECVRLWECERSVQSEEIEWVCEYERSVL